MRGKTANSWLPDDVVFLEGFRHTATCKIQKTALLRGPRPGALTADCKKGKPNTLCSAS